MFQANKRVVVKASVDNPSKKRLLTSTANYGFSGMNGGMMGMAGGGNMNVSSSGSGLLNNLDTMMVGLIPEDEASCLRMYRDIYNYDVVAGSAVDLMSTLPFSEFSLLGADEKELDVFYKNIENLNIKTLLPDMSVEYLVAGKFSGTMLYDENANGFTDIITHAPENLTAIPSPLYGADPMLIAKVTQEMRQFLNSKDPYFERLAKRIPDTMKDAMRQSSNVKLDPVMTLYLPRRTSSRSAGVSLYRRVLPIYLLEKVLYRGTITEANKRQRSTTHLTAGSEYWEAQDSDLAMLTSLFQQADLDPLGAIVATRNDVNVNEIRAGGDFWKWTDILDTTMGLKLKALGVSDAFLSGEANWNTADAALSVFLEQLRSYRDMVTYKVFYDKVFPIIAVMNGLKSDGGVNEKVLSSLQALGAQDLSNMMSQTQMDKPTDPNAVTQQGITDTKGLRSTETLPELKLGRRIRNKDGLLIPELHWHKQLKPEADREYLDVLNTLSEHGVPVTLRAWAAAGGVSIEHLTEELKEDMELRKQIAEIAKEGVPPQEGDDDSNDSTFARITAGRVIAEMSGANQRKVPLLGRDFSDYAEIKAVTKTGLPKYVPNQKKAQRDADDKIAASLRRLSDVSHYQDTVRKTKEK